MSGDCVAVYPTGGDDTSNIQNAVNSGKNVYLGIGTFNVKSRIVCNTHGQVIEGNDPLKTIINATSNFTGIGWNFTNAYKADPNRNGVFVLEKEGIHIKNLKMTFQQPNEPANRNQLIKYPPAIHISPYCTRFRIDNVRITKAPYGIYLNGNAGGGFIDRLEISFFEMGICNHPYNRVDGEAPLSGVLDTFRITNCHAWPFDLTSKQKSLMYGNDTTNTSHGPVFIYADDVDDLKLDNVTSLANISVKLNRTWMTGTNLDFERTGIIAESGSSVYISSSHFTVGYNSKFIWLLNNGGFVDISSSRFQTGSSNPDPSRPYLWTNNGTTLINGCTFLQKNHKQHTVHVGGPTSICVLNNNVFDVGSGTGLPFIVMATNKSSLTMVGNRFVNALNYTAPLTGVNAVSVEPGWHNISNNLFYGANKNLGSAGSNSIISNNK